MLLWHSSFSLSTLCDPLTSCTQLLETTDVVARATTADWTSLLVLSQSGSSARANGRARNPSFSSRCCPGLFGAAGAGAGAGAAGARVGVVVGAAAGGDAC